MLIVPKRIFCFLNIMLSFILTIYLILYLYQEDYRISFNAVFKKSLNNSLSFVKQKPKLILLWTRFPVYQINPRIMDDLNLCPEFNCVLTKNRTDFNKSSAVVFHGGDYTLTDLPKYRYQWQRFVFYTMESPQYTYIDLNGFSGYFNWTMTYRLDSDVPTVYGRYVKMNTTRDMQILNRTEILGVNKSYVAWLVGNCDPPSKREQYVFALQKYINVDIHGTCPFAKQKCGPKENAECNEKLSENYKFYLSFENSICTDYITEKFYSRSQLNLIPIVLRRKIVENILPPKSFIAADDFKHPKYLAKYLIELAEDDEKYLSYFQWRTEGYTLNHQMPGHYYDFCLMCQKLFTIPTDQPKIYANIKSWWHDDKCDSNFVPDQLNTVKN